LGVSNVLWAALIAAASAIVGGLIGGLITGRVTLQAEDKRQEGARELELYRHEREAMRERAVVRGAARAVQAQFLRVHTSCRRCVVDDTWWPSHQQPELSITLEDRKLIASNLDPNHWGSVLFGELMYGDLMGRYRRTAQLDRVDPPDLDDDDEESIVKAENAFAVAVVALTELAEMPLDQVGVALGAADARDAGAQPEHPEPGAD
jgi:hypothetical protein